VTLQLGREAVIADGVCRCVATNSNYFAAFTDGTSRRGHSRPCSSLLVQLNDILKEKCSGKITKEVLFFHDNAPAHRALAAQKKLAYLGFQCLDHPPCSPDLTPPDYRLFPGLEKTIERSPFFVRRGGHCFRGGLVERTTF